MNKRRKIPAVACLAVTVVLALETFATTAAAIQPKAAAARMMVQLKGFDDFVRTQLEKYHVPGAAVAIVNKDGPLFVKGYGLRDIAAKLPVTERTIMPIGSLTKSFTAFVIGDLVDDGRLDWDTPVRNYAPDFRMYDPFATERMTLRDMLCHRSGLPRHEFMWIGSPFSRAELFERLRYLEPNADFRSCYQYQNLIYMAAGYIAGKVAGMSWEQLVEERIFRPLGLASAGFSAVRSFETGDAARSYLYQNGTFEERPPSFSEDAVGPSGSICADVQDVARWLQLHLGNGEFNGRRIISESTLRLLHTPQMVIPEEPGDPTAEEMRSYRELGDTAYALGWMTGAYRGRRMVEHGGNTDGATSASKMLPDDGIGVVVLTNADHTDAADVICYNVFDRMLGLDQIDWSGRLLKIWQKVLDMIAGMKGEAASGPKEGTQPSHSLADYSGEYEHPGYGTFKIRVDGDRLKGYYNGHDWPITHLHYDVFRFEFWMLGYTFPGTFLTDHDGNIDRLSLPLESTVKEIVFIRKKV
jgi:CubicO group peptidase (beta-lactamase class C family)